MSIDSASQRLFQSQRAIRVESVQSTFFFNLNLKLNRGLCTENQRDHRPDTLLFSTQ